MKFILQIIKLSKKSAIGAAIAAVVAGASCSIMIAVMHYLLQGPSIDFWQLLLLFSILLFMYGGAFTFADYHLLKFSHKIMQSIRNQVAQQILGKKLRYIEIVGKDQWLSVLTSEINYLANIIDRLPSEIVNVAIILGCFSYMAWLSPLLSLIVVSVLIFGLWVFSFALKKSKIFFQDATKAWDYFFYHCFSLAHGTKELLQNNKRRNYFLQNFSQANESYVQKQFQGHIARSHSRRLGEVIFFTILAVLVVVLPYFSLITPEILTGFILVSIILLTRLYDLLNFLTKANEIDIRFAKIEKLGIDMFKPLSQNIPSQTLDCRDKNIVRLSGVQHSYLNENTDETFSVGPLSFSCESGNIIFLIGGNGSGKTTLAKILCGLYFPQKGEIFWNDVLISNANIDAYQEKFSVIFSDFYLFKDLLTIPQQSKIQYYLEKLRLDKKVHIANGQFSTIELSQGQRKRLTLLVEYLQDRPFYLFDEWACDQDPEFRKVFYQEILPELKNDGKIVFVITHDDQYFDLADQILKLNEGQLVKEVC